MPELPEVETIVRELRPHVVGQAIREVSVDWPRIIAHPPEDVEGFRRGLRGRRIERVWRRAKFAVLDLDDGASLIVHLRMSGRLVLAPQGRPEHLRIAFDLSGGTLYFYCQRKFGRVWLVADPQEVLGDLGPEPLSDAFTLERFTALLRARRGRIKPLLLNQRFIAGLGNIYTDESLFRAALHPCRTADTLRQDEIARLHGAIRSVLQQALDHHGTSFDGIFVRPQGEEGRQQEGLAVYGLEGAPCPRCGAAIERTVVGGRGTHFCPRCQALPAG